jgi:phage terminase small subunit
MPRNRRQSNPNPKHELFAQGLASGVGVGAAYVAAGYKDSPAAASRLSKNVKVRGRVAQIQATAEAQALLTLETHMHELERLRDLATRNGQMSAAIAAEVKRGELMGFYVQRRETTNAVYSISDKPMTPEEWEAEYGAVRVMDTPTSGIH